MIYKAQDNILNEIANIKNITTIKIWDLFLGSGTENYIVPSMMIMYDGGKTICLCSRDKYFDIFAKKVREVYQDEKDNSYNADPFNIHKNIDIDDKSLKILEGSSLEQVKNIYAYYSDKDSFNEPFIYEIDECNSLMEIVKYHLNKYLTNSNYQFKMDNYLKGYRSNYSVEGCINGLLVDTLIGYEKVGDNEYNLIIRGILPNDEFRMNIKFDIKGIHVSISNDDVVAYYEYVINNGKVIYDEYVSSNNMLLKHVNGYLEETTNNYSNITDLDIKNKYTYYRTLWNSLIGINLDTVDIQDNDKIINTSLISIENNNNNYARRIFYESRYDLKGNAGEDIILDDFNSTSIYKKINNSYLLQTKFGESGRDGYYKEYLSSKYFYSIINKKKLTPITKEDVYERTDIYSEDTINKVLEKR